MIPYDLDPSLHTCEPEPDVLDDGFSRPAHGDDATAVMTPPVAVDPALQEKSAF
jgi:hypothetical protein